MRRTLPLLHGHPMAHVAKIERGQVKRIKFREADLVSTIQTSDHRRTLYFIRH